MRKVQHGLWKTRVFGSRAQRGKHFMVQPEKAHLPPMRFKGTAFASGHPHAETVDLKAKALERLRMIIGRAKVEVAAGTPSSLHKALRYLETQFKVGTHPTGAFGSQGISPLENEPFYRDAKQTVMQARYLFNQGLYTNDEARRAQLFEESSQLILNFDANLPFIPRAVPKAEKPSVSVKVETPEPRVYIPRRRVKKKAPELPEPPVKPELPGYEAGLKAEEKAREFLEGHLKKRREAWSRAPPVAKSAMEETARQLVEREESRRLRSAARTSASAHEASEGTQ